MKFSSSSIEANNRVARFLKQVEKACLNLGVNKGRHLLIAFSGGGDSTALMALLHLLREPLGIHIAAMHVNHLLRRDACEDAEFTRLFCASLDITYKCVEVDVRELASQNSIGIEEAGRIARLEALECHRKKIGADFTVFAHHAGDLCEDVLLRLIRGCGWPALGGMKARNGYVLRPLLHFPKRRIKEFLSDLAIPWREDESNTSLHHRRNRIRHKVLPLLRAENPSLERSVINIHNLAECDAEYWDTMLTTALNENPWLEGGTITGPTLTLPASLLGLLPKSARLRLYCRALERACQLVGTSGQARSETLFMLDAAYTQRHTGKIYQFPGDIFARIAREGIIFFPGNAAMACEWIRG